MAMPTVVKSWAAGLLPNQRITFVSLLTTLGTYVVGITNQLIAKGYTCVGSSNGTVAAMDGVNRCTTAAGFAVRAANTTTAQSWIVISDGVTQTLFTFTGANDDVCRISFSPGSLFIVAGTATFAPTATDEQVFINTTLVGSTASADRVFHVWVDSTHRMWRAAICRQGVIVASLIGVELFDSTPLVGVTALPAVWGFALSNTNINAANLCSTFNLVSPAGGLCKTSGNSSTQLGGTCLSLGSQLNDPTQLTANGNQFAVRSLGLNSTSIGCNGVVGNRFDWYASSDLQACGALGGAATGKEWVQLNASTSGAVGVLWPWDSSTATCVTT